MFSVCEYFEHIEKASIEIQENRKPIDHSIILWWGLDGLQLNDDGNLEWISKKTEKIESQNVFYQPQQSIIAIALDCACQCNQSQIDRLKEENAILQIQCQQSRQQESIVKMLQSDFYNPLMPDYSWCCCNFRR